MKKLLSLLDQFFDFMLYPFCQFCVLIYCFINLLLAACPDDWCYECVDTGVWVCLCVLVFITFVANLLGCFKKIKREDLDCKSSALADDNKSH